MTEIEETQLLNKAQRRARLKISFYIHALVFTLVNLFLLILNLIVSPDKLWFFWSLFGWGIGFVSHAIATYTSVSDIEDNLIQKEMEKYKKREKK